MLIWATYIHIGCYSTTYHGMGFHTIKILFQCTLVRLVAIGRLTQNKTGWDEPQLVKACSNIYSTHPVTCIDIMMKDMGPTTYPVSDSGISTNTQHKHLTQNTQHFPYRILICVAYFDNLRNMVKKEASRFALGFLTGEPLLQRLMKTYEIVCGDVQGGDCEPLGVAMGLCQTLTFLYLPSAVCPD